QRETSVQVEVEGKSLSFRVREKYSNWKLNHNLDNAMFHVEGMGKPDSLVDAPEDPEAFEREQTRKFLGIEVKVFPNPQGLTGFDELPADAPRFEFTITERKPS